MDALRSIRDGIKRFEVLLYFVTALLGLYLAAGNILRAAKVPSEQAWKPWEALFVILIICAVWVPFYALYKAIDARLEALDKQRSELEKRRSDAERDLALLCQQVVGAIADACRTVGVNDLAACVWTCRTNGDFHEVAQFYLPYLRRGSGVKWRKGVGVAGWAWETDGDLCSDLRPMLERLDAIGATAFDALPPDERLGLHAADLNATRACTGVCALRLFSKASAPELLGVFVLDYTGATGFDCVGCRVATRPVSTFLGACEKVLTEAGAALK